MSDFFDELSTPDAPQPQDPTAPMAVLAISAPAINPEEFDARCECYREIFNMKLPVVFESEDGRLENDHEFEALRTRLGRRPTPAEAVAYIDELTAPGLAKWQPIIEAAREQGIPNHLRQIRS